MLPGFPGPTPAATAECCCRFVAEPFGFTSIRFWWCLGLPPYTAVAILRMGYQTVALEGILSLAEKSGGE